MDWGADEMNTIYNAEYYLSRKTEIMERYYDTHARAWKPFMVQSYGPKFTEVVLKETRQQFEEFIPNIPYIGGDENTFTHQILRSISALILYKVMKTQGKNAEEVGKIVYDAVEESVRHLPPLPGRELTPEFRSQQIALAKKSQERRYPDDWVFEYVEGDGVEFDYGSDYIECAAQKLYHVHDADEFLPYFCYLDFVTARTPGWGFTRTETLAEGYSRCNFRSKKGGVTKKGWPPPFLTK
jgi:hypothetical protein